MGLFKDFKDDLSQAAKELASGEEQKKKVAVQEIAPEIEEVKETAETEEAVEPEEVAEAVEDEVNIPVLNLPPVSLRSFDSSDSDEETTVITENTVITGDLQSSGSFNIKGTINGNIMCAGKIVVTGTINGNTNSDEFIADVAKIEGEITCAGNVKIGDGSVLIGNIASSSAVIAGAIKGDIDVQGPVLIEASAVIMGNIKSRSVEIATGAVIEGFCSQCYADIDVSGLFASR